MLNRISFVRVALIKLCYEPEDSINGNAEVVQI